MKIVTPTIIFNEGDRGLKALRVRRLKTNLTSIPLTYDLTIALDDNRRAEVKSHTDN